MLSLEKRIVRLEELIIELENKIEEQRFYYPPPNDNDALIREIRRRQEMGEDPYEYLKKVAHDQNMVYAAEQRRMANRRYQELEEVGASAEGYVFKKRVFRQGFIHGDLFYFRWGSTSKWIEKEDVFNLQIRRSPSSKNQQ